MTPSANLLFVYGTLLAADTGKTGRTQRERLAREARVIGPATVTGRLYDLGRYPALVIDTEIRDTSIFPSPMSPTSDDAGRKIEVSRISSIVHGELLELAYPEHSYRWLDAYEGIVPGNHPHNDYERVARTVTRPDGTTSSAQVYVWRAALGPAATLILGGSWLDRC